MEITVNGNVHELKFTFKAIKAITKLLGCPKISELEKALNKIGYDNAAAIASAALNANGVKVKPDEVEASIESAGFPVELATAIAQAIAPDTANVGEDVAAGN